MQSFNDTCCDIAVSITIRVRMVLACSQRLWRARGWRLGECLGEPAEQLEPWKPQKSSSVLRARSDRTRIALSRPADVVPSFCDGHERSCVWS
eukprot:1936748-Rhodomonas_salina.1